VVGGTTSGSCGARNNTASFTSGNGGSGSASASTTVLCPSVSITKTADAASVTYGSQIGFTVTLSNTGGAASTGLTESDALPSGPGINWSIDAGNTDSGWSVTGSPPNQHLAYSPTTLPANSSTHAHVISGTTGDS